MRLRLYDTFPVSRVQATLHVCRLGSASWDSFESILYLGAAALYYKLTLLPGLAKQGTAKDVQTNLFKIIIMFLKN